MKIWMPAILHICSYLQRGKTLRENVKITQVLIYSSYSYFIFWASHRMLFEKLIYSSVGTQSKTTSVHLTENIRFSTGGPSNEPTPISSTVSPEFTTTESVQKSSSVLSHDPVTTNTTVSHRATGTILY